MAANQHFKRFNTSNNGLRHANDYVGENGELTWDPDNGLRLHDGSTAGGNTVGGGGGGGTVNEGTSYLDYGMVDNGSGNVTININFKYHWLVSLTGNPEANRRYYLANGNDGDTFYFMPSTPFDPTNTTMWVDSMGYYGNGGYTTGSANIQLFGTDASNADTLIRATWFNGSWHFSGKVTLV